MKLVGEIELFGKVHFATVEVQDTKGKGITYVSSLRKYKAYGYLGGKIQFYGYYDEYDDAARAVQMRRNIAKDKRIVPNRRRRGTGVSYIPSTGKFKARGVVDGRMKFFGYYDNEADALEAVAQQRNIAKDKRGAKPGAAVKDFATGISFDGRSRTWRVKLQVNGKRASLGNYQTYGHAVLVRDVVARRTGKPVVVTDYAMPLGLVTDPVARSFITDPIRMVSQQELTEYMKRIADLNRTLGIEQSVH